jgi:hypothetical protein
LKPWKRKVLLSALVKGAVSLTVTTILGVPSIVA